MPSTYTQSLRLEMQATGENDAVWGEKNNANLGTVLEMAIAGVQPITMSDVPYTLTTAYGEDDEARKMVLYVTGSNSGVRDVICPAVTKLYVIDNMTAGGFAIRVKTPAGTGVTVSNGVRALLYCDGSNVISIASSAVPDTSVSPSKIDQTVNYEWRFNSAVGIGMVAPYAVNWGGLFVGGVTGGQVGTFVNGVMGAQIAATGTEGQINSPNYALTFNVGGAKRATIYTDGSVAVPGPFVAGQIASLGGYVGLTLANVTGALGYTPANLAGAAFTGNVEAASLSVRSAANYISLINTTEGKTRFIHNNGGLIGFLNPSGSWIFRVDDSGNATTPGSHTVGGILSVGNYIYSNGDIYAFSDERVKTNWRQVPDFVPRLAKVKRGVYDRTDCDRTQVGVTAQSLQAVLPDAVHADEKGNLSVSYGQAALMSAVELAEYVVALEARLTALENK